MTQVMNVNFTLLKCRDTSGFSVLYHYTSGPHTLVAIGITGGPVRLPSPILRVFDSIGLGCGLRIHISKFPTDPDTAGLETTL